MQLFLRNKSKIVCWLALFVLCGGLPPSAEVLFAADCVAVRAKVQKERNLLKKNKLLGQVIHECAGDPVLNYYYAYAQERLGKYNEALRYYTIASELDPGAAGYLFGMADVCVALGKDISAIDAYEKGLEIESGNRRALRKLDILRIKYKAQMGEMVTSEEVVAVMTTEDVQPYTKQSVDGPLLSMQIPYKRNSPALSDTAKALLDIVGWALRDVSLQGASFEVAGHTDSTGSKDGNLLLSKYRAEAVKEYLVQMHQIDASRLRVAWFGDSEPLAPNTTVANREINRRVEFRRVDLQR